MQLELAKQVTVHQEAGAEMMKQMRDDQTAKDLQLKKMSK